MNKSAQILSAGMLCLVFSQTHAGEVPFPQCPQKIPVQQVVETTPTDGWEIVNDTDKHQLRSISISDEQSPSIPTGRSIPAKQRRPNGDVTVFYDASPACRGSRSYWAVCKYFGSDVTLVQQLPRNIARCEVKYRNDVTVPEQITIKCFDSQKDPCEGL